MNVGEEIQSNSGKGWRDTRLSNKMRNNLFRVGGKRNNGRESTTKRKLKLQLKDKLFTGQGIWGQWNSN